MSGHPNEPFHLQKDVHPIQKQESEDLTHLPPQQSLTIHQIPISHAAVVSYNHVENPISTSTLQIPPAIIENTSASILPSTNVTLSNSMHNNTATLNSPSIDLASLSNSNQVALKAEYAEPKLEYS